MKSDSRTHEQGLRWAIQLCRPHLARTRHENGIRWFTFEWWWSVRVGVFFQPDSSAIPPGMSAIMLTRCHDGLIAEGQNPRGFCEEACARYCAVESMPPRSFADSGSGKSTARGENLPPLRRIAQQALMFAATLGRPSLVHRWMTLQWWQKSWSRQWQEHCRRVRNHLEITWSLAPAISCAAGARITTWRYVCSRTTSSCASDVTAVCLRQPRCGDKTSLIAEIRPHDTRVASKIRTARRRRRRGSVCLHL